MPPKVIKIKTDAPPKRKKAANGHQRPEPAPPGTILTEVSKQEWKLGPAIGTGGFGDIYSACRIGAAAARKKDDYAYVVKIEPHNNGPLFVEMHFYMRNAKLEDIESFRKKHKLSCLGIPYYVGSGSHDLNNIKHRFLVMPKYGRDIWTFYMENKRLPLHTIYRLAIQMIDSLQYIHHCGYVHGDIKGANILLGADKIGESQSFLVDFGLACRSTTQKIFKPDPKKKHNGTIEYTSRDAHNGVPTMRGDMEILAYNLLHWTGIELPWISQKLLAKPHKVQEAKEQFMDNLKTSIRQLFDRQDDIPQPIVDMFEMVNSLEFDEQPDYSKMRKLFEQGLKTLGKSNSGELEFKLSTTSPAITKTKKPAETVKLPISLDSSIDDDSFVTKRKPRKKIDNNKNDENPINATLSPVQGAVNFNNLDDKNDDNDDNSATSSVVEPIRKSRKKTLKDTIATSDTGNIVVNNEITQKGKRKDKTYEFNFELDVSIDANVVVNVKRKNKNEKKITENGENADTPNGTPVAKLRTTKTRSKK